MPEEKTIKVYKDKKHKLAHCYGSKDLDHTYICGPRTNNLWYKVIVSEGSYVIAKVAEL